MKLTENYGLKKPDPTDVVNVYDFNYNADIIDSKLKEAEESLSGLELVASNVKMADGSTVENTVSGNKNDISNINYELSKTENTKYTTVNGIKEFSCKDGYVDNVAIEGKTLVNLFSFDTTRASFDGSIIRTYAKNDSRIINGTYTVYNFTDKAIHYTKSKLSDGTYLGSVDLTPNSCKVVELGADERIYGCDFWTQEGWVGETSQYIDTSIKLLVLEGNHTDKPITYFEGLKSVGQGDKIEVLSCGEDVQVLKNFTKGLIQDSSGNYLTNVDLDKYLSCLDYVSVSNSCEYFIDFDINKVYFYDSAKKYIGHVTLNAERQTITGNNTFKTPNNCAFIRFRYNLENNTRFPKFATLCKKQDKKQIPTTLRSLPNGVKDTIEKRGNKYVKVQRCGEYTLVESDVQSIQNIRENCCAIITNRFPNQKKLKNADLKDTLLCNMFSQKPHIKYMEDTEGIHEQATQNQDMFFDILKSKLPSVDVNGARTWLKSNPVTVVYELATPIITELPNFNPQTFEGDTTLLINSGDIQAEADFEVTNSIGSEIDVLKDKVSDNDSKLLLKSDKGHYHSCDENMETLWKGSINAVSGDIPLTDSVLNYKALIVNVGNVGGGKNTSFTIYPFNLGYRQESHGKIRATDEMYITLFGGTTPYRYYFRPSSTPNNLYFEIRNSSNVVVSSNPDSQLFNIRYIVGVK